MMDVVKPVLKYTSLSQDLMDGRSFVWLGDTVGQKYQIYS